jgi:hypothetical protein
MLPYHGTCWHNALKAVKSSCDKLDDNEHVLLSLFLANCFLEDSGHVIYVCHTIDDKNKRRYEIIIFNQILELAYLLYIIL